MSEVVRTFLVFLDVPKHVEFRVDGFPLLAEGTVVNFDFEMKDPEGLRKPRTVKGPYVVRRRSLHYAIGRPSRDGFSQYLEVEPEGTESS